VRAFAGSNALKLDYKYVIVVIIVLSLYMYVYMTRGQTGNTMALQMETVLTCNQDCFNVSIVAKHAFVGTGYSIFL